MSSSQNLSLMFPDGAVRAFPVNITGAEIAGGISPSLLKRTIAMALDGVVADLADPITHDAKIEFLNRDDPRALVVRTAAFFGPWDGTNFLTLGLQALREGQRWPVANDQTVSPTYVCDLVMCSLDLLIDDECGIWHLANQGSTTWADLALTAAGLSGLDKTLVDAVAGRDLGQLAQRPARAELGSERGTVMPPLQDALQRYLLDRARPAALPQEELPMPRPALRLVA